MSVGSCLSPEPEVLGYPLSAASSRLPSGPARPPGAQLASCRPQVATQGWGTEFPGGLQQTSRRLLAEMPGKKARKNAQPSPTRAPAGRDQMGSAAILAGLGVGGRDLSLGGVSQSALGLKVRRGLRPCTCCKGASWKFFRGFT